MRRKSDSTTRPAAAAEAAPALRRRDILRRGAALGAGAAGAAIALKPHAASADDGDNLVLGQRNTSTVGDDADRWRGVASNRPSRWRTPMVRRCG